jgi:type IV pilus assembly protein PilY1
MDSGIRTLVVGMVDPDTDDQLVVDLRQSLNDLAQAGDPILSSDIGGNEVYVPNPDAKAYFATNVTELMASLNSILTRINAGKFAAGAPVVLPLYSDGTNQKVLFSASYKINTMDQWDAWLSKYVMSGDFEANEAWEFNGGKLVPTRTTRRVYTIPTSKGEGGTTSQLVNALTAAEVEALTGVPQAKATEFTTWLRQYNQFQILGDMENSGMQIVDYDDADAKTIYLQTNRGVLHALDFASGDETWGFFPPNVFQTRLKSLKYSAEGDWYDGDGVNTVRSVAYDLLDGPLTYKNVSVNSMASDYKTILFGNLGRGGNGIYAMDITQPFTTPRFLWAVDNDRYDGGPSKEVALWGNSVSASNTSLYEKLGMTIAPGLFLSADVSDLDKRNILFLPGGLGYKLGEDDQGKIFYAIAPYDGSVLRAFTEDSGFAGANGAHLGMGIAPVTAHFDENTKTIHDFFVVPDSEGNVLFCDATLPLNFWSLKSIFQLTNSADIPVSIPKTLGLVKTQNKQLWVYGGSAPLDGPDKDEEGYNRGIVNEQNYIFGFNLTKASGDVGLTTADIDMKELKYIRDTTPLLPIFGQPWVSGDNQLDPSLIKGWYLGLRPRQPMDDMGTEPEYVTTSPYFYSNTLYVSTFIPRVKMPNEYDICPDLGHSKIYALDPLTGEGQWKDENGDKGVQSVLIKDVKITGITSLNGRIYVGVKPLKPSALEELPAQVSESKFLFPGGTMWSFGALNYEGEARPPSLDPDVPYIQYWKDIVNP